jgi:hypothetical protein
MSHVNIRYRMSDVRCRTSFRGGRFRCFKGTIISFIIRIPCTILVIAVLSRQGWNRASKDNDVMMRPKQLLFMHISYTISYTISYVRRTISYVKIQVLASRTCDAVYDVVYDIVRFLYHIVRATYDIAEKRTTSYIFYRFLPVVRATSHTTSYVFWRCRIRCAMQHWYYTITYVRFRCRWFISPKTYDITLRRRMQYRSIRYAIRSIRLAWGGGRRGGTYWPCPSSSHGSCFLILGPAG